MMKEFSEKDRGPLGLADNQWLARIATGKIDVRELVAAELANRGLDKFGKWVGFEQAAELAKPQPTPELINEIGKSLGFETLKSRNSDRLDFKDVSCVELERALADAFEAGRRENTQSITRRQRPARETGLVR